MPGHCVVDAPLFDPPELDVPEKLDDVYRTPPELDEDGVTMIPSEV